MNITCYWKETQPVNELKIIAHPKKKRDVALLENTLKTIEPQLHVINPRSNRKLLLSLSTIDSIQSFGHLCHIFIEIGEQFLIQKRLKAILKMNFANFVQINNSTILNLTPVVSFEAGQDARLEIRTHSNNHYIVSRHYEKLIKESLS